MVFSLVLTIWVGILANVKSHSNQLQTLCKYDYNCTGQVLDCENANSEDDVVCVFKCHGKEACSNTTINCLDDIHCYIYCGGYDDDDNACADSTINCPDNAQCTIENTNKMAMRNSKVNCGYNGYCDVRATHDFAMEDAIIDATHSEYLVYMVRGYLTSSNLQIYLPNRISWDSDHENSIEIQSDYNQTLDGISIYSSIDIININFEIPSTTDYDSPFTLQNAYFYCGDTYERSCEIEAVITANETYLSCNEQGNMCANFNYTYGFISSTAVSTTLVNIKEEPDIADFFDTLLDFFNFEDKSVTWLIMFFGTILIFIVMLIICIRFVCCRKETRSSFEEIREKREQEKFKYCCSFGKTKRKSAVEYEEEEELQRRLVDNTPTKRGDDDYNNHYDNNDNNDNEEKMADEYGFSGSNKNSSSPKAKHAPIHPMTFDDGLREKAKHDKIEDEEEKIGINMEEFDFEKEKKKLFKHKSVGSIGSIISNKDSPQQLNYSSSDDDDAPWMFIDDEDELSLTQSEFDIDNLFCNDVDAVHQQRNQILQEQRQLGLEQSPLSVFGSGDNNKNIDNNSDNAIIIGDKDGNNKNVAEFQKQLDGNNTTTDGDETDENEVTNILNQIQNHDNINNNDTTLEITITDEMMKKQVPKKSRFSGLKNMVKKGLGGKKSNKSVEYAPVEHDVDDNDEQSESMGGNVEMSQAKVVQTLRGQGYEDTYIRRCLRLYKKNYDIIQTGYDIETLIEILTRLQKKDELKEVHKGRFGGHLTLEEAQALEVGDKIDHRDNAGKWNGAIVKEKYGGGLLKVHYSGWSKKWDCYPDYTQDLHFFAKHGSISKRPAHRFLDLQKGDFIDININVQHKDGEWSSGEIKKLDKSSGQVQVFYQHHDGQHLVWVHLDDENEVATFTSKVM